MMIGVLLALIGILIALAWMAWVGWTLIGQTRRPFAIASWPMLVVEIDGAQWADLLRVVGHTQSGVTDVTTLLPIEMPLMHSETIAMAGGAGPQPAAAPTLTYAPIRSSVAAPVPHGPYPSMVRVRLFDRNQASVHSELDIPARRRAFTLKMDGHSYSAIGQAADGAWEYRQAD